MKKLITLLTCLFLVGCDNSQDYSRTADRPFIIGKKLFLDNCSEYTIYVKKSNGLEYRYSIILPNNFGEVDYFVTTTNGLQAWKK